MPNANTPIQSIVPPVVLEATHEKSLAIVPRQLLERHAVKPA